jgi:hypothetical protein
MSSLTDSVVVQGGSLLDSSANQGMRCGSRPAITDEQLPLFSSVGLIEPMAHGVMVPRVAEVLTRRADQDGQAKTEPERVSSCA